jgi:hypothetical protein
MILVGANAGDDESAPLEIGARSYYTFAQSHRH